MALGWEPKCGDREHAERYLVRTCMDIADKIKAPALLQPGGAKRRIWEAVQELDYWKRREPHRGDDGPSDDDASAGEPAALGPGADVVEPRDDAAPDAA